MLESFLQEAGSHAIIFLVNYLYNFVHILFWSFIGKKLQLDRTTEIKVFFNIYQDVLIMQFDPETF